jgi:hypothetical protein
MILVFNGTVLVTPAATEQGMVSLADTMQHAIEKWQREGKPLSNQG